MKHWWFSIAGASGPQALQTKPNPASFLLSLSPSLSLSLVHFIFYFDGNKCVICNSFQLLRLFNWVGSNYALAISIINYALITRVFMLVTAGFGTDGGSAVWFQPVVAAISVPAEETGQVDLGMFFNCASDAGSGETCWYACQSQHSDCHNSSESSSHLTLSSTFLPFLGFIASDKISAVGRWVLASLERALLKESASKHPTRRGEGL